MNTIYTDSNYVCYLQNNMIHIIFGNFESDNTQELTTHTEMIVSIDSFIAFISNGKELLDKMKEGGLFEEEKPKKKRTTRRKKTS